jgi:ribonuclease HI
MVCSIYRGGARRKKLKFKLEQICSNNQAEQLAIVKALEVIEMQQVKTTNPAKRSSTQIGK